jgi:hypothetical protein
LFRVFRWPTDERHPAYGGVFQRALGRAHDPHRIDAWHALLRESLFTPSGQRRLLDRMGMTAENAEGISP